MSFATELRDSYNEVINSYGESGVFFMLPQNSAANEYGDLAANPYVSGTSGLVFVQPITEEDLLKEEMGERVGGTMKGYIKSGLTINSVDLGTGWKVETAYENYEIVTIDRFRVEGEEIYTRLILNKLTET